MSSPTFRRGEYGIYFINDPGDPWRDTPAEKRHMWRTNDRERRFLLWFGACVPTLLMVWERSLEAALETAAEWLADNAPGHLMAHNSDELTDLYREAFDDLRDELLADEEIDETIRTFDNLCDSCWEGPMDRVSEAATVGLTYTEAGYLTSHEWGIVAEQPDRATVLDIQASSMVSICERREPPKPKAPVAAAV